MKWWPKTHCGSKAWIFTLIYTRFDRNIQKTSILRICLFFLQKVPKVCQMPGECITRQSTLIKKQNDYCLFSKFRVVHKVVFWKESVFWHVAERVCFLVSNMCNYLISVWMNHFTLDIYNGSDKADPAIRELCINRVPLAIRRVSNQNSALRLIQITLSISYWLKMCHISDKPSPLRSNKLSIKS